jgi:hypothetical protein
MRGLLAALFVGATKQQRGRKAALSAEQGDFDRWRSNSY